MYSGRLEQIKGGSTSDATELMNLSYSYDLAGNITSIVDGKMGPQTQSFTYDEMDRLTSAEANGGTQGTYNSENYTYSSSTGSLASKGGVSYTYGNSDHKHAVTSLSNGWTYQYDQNGNMTERNVDSSTYSLTYDAYNHLISVSGASSVDFVYDGDGQRVKVGGTVYIGDYYRYYGSGYNKYYFADGKRIALRFNTGSQANNYYSLSDHLNSSTVLVNEDRSYIGREGYKAWGETRFGGVGLHFKFTGEYYVSNIGLYHFGARFYDPLLGRFTQADTDVPGNQGVQGFDRYTYANNSLLRYIDPTGHSIWDVVGAFSTGFVYEFARVNAWMSPQAQEALSVNATESDAMLAGRITADVSSIIVGVGEVAGGIAVGTGGTAVACGTTLCIGAVATVSVGAVMAAHGTTTALAGAAGLGGNFAQISGKDGANNNSGGMLGEKGPQIFSKNLWKGKQGRLDVENPSPGKRPGQIHFQAGKNKWYYDPINNAFRPDKNTGTPPPRWLIDLLEEDDFIYAIDKGLRYLGE